MNAAATSARVGWRTLSRGRGAASAIWRAAAERRRRDRQFCRAIATRGGGGATHPSRSFASSSSFSSSSSSSSSPSSSSGPSTIAAAETDDTIREDVVRDLFRSYAGSADPSHPNRHRRQPSLSRDDIRDLLSSMGYRPPDDIFRLSFDAADSDGSGTLNYSEFLDGYRAAVAGELGSDDLRRTIADADGLVRIFRELDRNADGYVSRGDLLGMLDASGRDKRGDGGGGGRRRGGGSGSGGGGGGGGVGSREARKIIKRADADGSGTIGLPEFLAFMTDPDSSDVNHHLRSGFRAAFVVGGPRSGKSSLCRRLEGEADMIGCDAGVLLREEVERGSALGDDIADAMGRGWPVPSSTVMALVRRKISGLPGSFVALDGFPRSKRNCRDFEKVFGTPEFAIYIECPEEIMIQRLLEETSGDDRAGDAEKAKSRVGAFRALAVPMMKHLNDSGVVVHTLDGNNSPGDIWAELLSLNMLLNKRVKRNSK